ncbi:hypothetical protein UT300005_18910 [Clostridium sp. CTA-5]
MDNDMNNDCSVNNCISNNIHANLSTSDPKIKCYGSDDNTCIFETINDDLRSNNKIDMECDMDDFITDYKEKMNDCINNQKDDFNNKFDTINEDSSNHYTSNMKKNRLNYQNESCSQHIRGKIVVVSILNCGQEKTYLEGAKINIYRLNGVCPVFIKSCLTDKSGKAIFNNLSEGCYRIIEIVNKNYFQKPKYIKWNEVCISSDNTEDSIMIVNNLKQSSISKIK